MGCSLCKPRGQMLSYEESTALQCVIRDEAVPRKAAKKNSLDDRLRVVSLKSIAKLVDAHRASVRRWLDEERIRPLVMGRGRNAAIRHRRSDIKRWLEQLEEID